MSAIPFAPPVTDLHSVNTILAISPNRKVTNTKYLPERRITIGPKRRPARHAAAIPSAADAIQGRPTAILVNTDVYAAMPIKAA
jgi:hypothetical protein